jgi:hypothetical protein
VATNAQMARLLYALGDTLLEGTAAVSRIPAPALQTFVEGVAVGTSDMVKKKKKGRRAVSAYNRAFAKAFKRQKAKMTKKNGDWKKNCNSSKCMKAAHKDTRRSMK